MKYDKVMLRTAEIWSELSSCKRNKVGAVLARENRIISIGYNGTISKSNNKCETTYVVCSNCKNTNIKVIDDSTVYCKECKQIYTYDIVNKTNHNKVIHAEMNAILFASKLGIKTNDTTLYVTTSPCSNCSKHIIQAGIKRVVYLNEYKDDTGIRLLKDNNIMVHRCLLDG